jgi:hypothetical protein
VGNGQFHLEEVAEGQNVEFELMVRLRMWYRGDGGAPHCNALLTQQGMEQQKTLLRQRIYDSEVSNQRLRAALAQEVASLA